MNTKPIAFMILGLVIFGSCKLFKPKFEDIPFKSHAVTLPAWASQSWQTDTSKCDTSRYHILYELHVDTIFAYHPYDSMVKHLGQPEYVDSSYGYKSGWYRVYKYDSKASSCYQRMLHFTSDGKDQIWHVFVTGPGCG